MSALSYLRALRLFSRIVWRDWEDIRLTVGMAWRIAVGVHSGLDRLKGMS